MPVQITMSLTNIFQYISFSAPLLLVFFITLYSIMQNKLERGLIFNMGIVILSTIVYILKNILKNKQSTFASPFCNVLPGPFTVKAIEGIFNAPSMSSSIVAFASTYLIYPMLINNQLNLPLLIFLISTSCVNSIVELQQNCSDIMGIVLGLLVGIIFGIGYYFILKMSNENNLVYFSDPVSNNVQCSKPTQQNFKCEVFKNGVSIGPTSTLPA